MARSYDDTTLTVTLETQLYAVVTTLEAMARSACMKQDTNAVHLLVSKSRSYRTDARNLSRRFEGMTEA